MFDINGYEIIALIVVAVVVLGPERLPAYAAKLGQFVRQARAMAEGAKSQLKDQLGPEFDDLNWKQYDPRQYDPRRIVREALFDPDPATGPDSEPAHPMPHPMTSPAGAAYDPSRPVPWDPDST